MTEGGGLPLTLQFITNLSCSLETNLCRFLVSMIAGPVSEIYTLSFKSTLAGAVNFHIRVKGNVNEML